MIVDYDTLLSKYDCQFEGLDNPVFYSSLYPTALSLSSNSIDADTEQDFWNKFNFGDGLKFSARDSGEPNKDRRQEKNYKNNCFKYHDILKQFFTDLDNSCKNNIKVGVITIPSSHQGTINQVTKLTKYLFENTTDVPSNFDNLTTSFTRTADKQSAHEDGNRDISRNVETLALRDKNELTKYNLILVIDDIVTTGNSFQAVKKVLDKAEYKGEIVNFAFCRSMNYMAIKSYEDATQENKIAGIIFDFDQTLVNDVEKDENFESELKNIDIKKFILIVLFWIQKRICMAHIME